MFTMWFGRILKLKYIIHSAGSANPDETAADRGRDGVYGPVGADEAPDGADGGGEGAGAGINVMSIEKCAMRLFFF